jgi:hypothetical protein
MAVVNGARDHVRRVSKMIINHYRLVFCTAPGYSSDREKKEKYLHVVCECERDSETCNCTIKIQYTTDLLNLLIPREFHCIESTIA